MIKSFRKLTFDAVKLARHHAVALLMFSFTLLAILYSCNSGTGGNGKPVSTDTLKRKEIANPYSTNDQSPLDLAYFPPDYPILKMNGSADSHALIARVLFSRPQKKGRQIFGTDNNALCQYGKEWRLGANEATEIEFFKPVVLGKTSVKPGRYVLYCVPYEDKWTIILNGNLFTWGLHMDKSQDIASVDIPVGVQSPPLEDFTMAFLPAPHGADLVMAWDTVRVVLPVKAVL